MKKLLSLCIGMLSIGLHAADTVFVKNSTSTDIK